MEARTRVDEVRRHAGDAMGDRPGRERGRLFSYTIQTMRILVTNDDGTNPEGLWTLAEAITMVGEVVVVAPDRDL